MEAQEVFDTVAVHLLTQGRKSMLNTADFHCCAYRGDDGCKCAVGCLIPDDKYTPNMEAKLVNSVIRKFADCGLEPRHVTLYERLQNVHDNAASYLWSERLLDVASSYRLKPDVVLNFKEPENSNEPNHDEAAPSTTNPAV